MDPTACFHELLKSLQDGDTEAAQEHARNLKCWLDRGGFCPQGQSISAVNDRLAEVLQMTPAAHFDE